jgi:membrane-bound lytic murein transglycosylase D
VEGTTIARLGTGRARSRAAAASCALLLAACASQPPQLPPAPEAVPAPRPTQVSPVVELRQAHVEPAPRRAASAPLDATRLPPFDGTRQEVSEPLRGVARIDRTVRHDDVWQRVRDGFSMPNLENSVVNEKMAWYAARPEYLKRMFERGRLYLYHIVEEIEKRGMPTELALLPMVESSFNPMAYSRAHASGLWQFIPGTGKRYDLAQNWWYDARRDIVASTEAALEYLKDVYEMHGDWHLALASYNWGEHAVARALERNRAAGLPLDFSSLAMPLETRHYVPKLQALKNIIANPAPFGIELEPIPNEPYFGTVAKTRDIDLRLAAKLAEMSLEEFVALNPGFNRPLIRAAVSPRIVLPADRIELFRANLLKHDAKTLVSWRTYQPRAGEKLEAIARKFGISQARLREVNGIGPRIRSLPALLVVPANGAADLARLPIMYAPPIPAAAAGRPARRSVVHAVKPGETLASIAARYGVSVEELRRWNKPGRLLAGHTLTIQTRVVAPTPRAASKRKPLNKRAKVTIKQASTRKIIK